jgi:hypothetical protein
MSAEQAKTSADSAAKSERKKMLAAERANPTLRDRRKAIEGLVKMGMSPEAATASMEGFEAHIRPTQSRTRKLTSETEGLEV